MFLCFIWLCSDSSNDDDYPRLDQKANWRMPVHKIKFTYKPFDFDKIHDSHCYFMYWGEALATSWIAFVFKDSQMKRSLEDGLNDG